jgi:RNA polymerase sigma-70 factor, ECF subfamily
MRATIGEMARAANIAVLCEALGDVGRPDELAEWLDAAIVAGRAAWPRVELDEDLYVAHVARQARTGEPLATFRTSDLYLAAACAAGISSALVEFEATYRGDLEAIVRRAAASVDVDEVTQNIRETLFVGRDGMPPKIGDYAGRGELRAWLRVVATRAALNAATRGPKDRPGGEDDQLIEAAGAAESAEVAYFRLHYEAEVKAAFPEALAALTAHDRLVLRQHYIDQLTLDDMARVHAVHVATVKRHLATARNDLTANLRSRLCAKLKVSPSELESVLAIVQSRLHLTMKRLL